MDATQRTELLRQLHRGETSRNREFERFRDRDARRVLSAYHRLRSLLHDLVRPGVLTRTRSAPNPGGLAVAIEDPALRYRRVVVLTPWEAEFLREQTSTAPLLEEPRSVVS